MIVHSLKSLGHGRWQNENQGKSRQIMINMVSP